MDIVGAGKSGVSIVAVYVVNSQKHKTKIDCRFQKIEHINPSQDYRLSRVFGVIVSFAFGPNPHPINVSKGRRIIQRTQRFIGKPF